MYTGVNCNVQHGVNCNAQHLQNHPQKFDIITNYISLSDTIFITYRRLVLPDSLRFHEEFQPMYFVLAPVWVEVEHICEITINNDQTGNPF